MNPIDFSELLAMTKDAFDKSHVKEIAERQEEEWYYSICSTRIVTGSVLIVGFNWGTGKCKHYSPQVNEPIDTFLDLLNRKDGLGSLKRVEVYLNKYLPEHLSTLGQTNYCFFRSRKESEITLPDLALCEPLFYRFLQLALPSKIVSISSRLRDYFVDSKSLEVAEWTSFQTSCGNIRVGKGVLTVPFQNTSIPIFFLPHPMAHISGTVRDQAWDYCFNSSAH